MLPAALTPFVEKRLESALTDHWQVRVAEKLRLHAGSNGDIAWDQAALLNAIDRFWSDAFKNVLGRAERSIVNELQEESYEIVHRRLFKDIPGDRFHHRDNTLKQFARLYRENANEFPRGSADEDYRRKLEKAYPIHPELFDQLYAGWGSLERFQRTRGVLRLMAQAIHEL